MDEKGNWKDNVFVECLWYSIKSEEVYLKGHGLVTEATFEIGHHNATWDGTAGQGQNEA